MKRVYLDYNATTPLALASRDAMIEAMDVIGNPSSVHAEGRAAKAIVEKSRRQVAEALGAEPSEVVFTSGATEACFLALSGNEIQGAEIEHDAVRAHCVNNLSVEHTGRVRLTEPSRCTLQAANSETGLLQSLPQDLFFSDMTQAFGKSPLAFGWSGIKMAAVSAHKIGGPKGVGALLVKKGVDFEAPYGGGGQEMGRRSGTENIISIAGFGAAAQAAQRSLADGDWERVRDLRDEMEAALLSASDNLIIIGKDEKRLPNTSCIIARGWKGETQVMQMDLSGFAVSAGSACSSGKVKASTVLTALGFDAEAASCAVRVSLGPATTRQDINRFVDHWLAKKTTYMMKRAG